MKCVMCNHPKEQRLDNEGNIVLIHFIDPKTKEQLCEQCNKINNEIYSQKGKTLRGELKIERIK